MLSGDIKVHHKSGISQFSSTQIKKMLPNDYTLSGDKSSSWVNASGVLVQIEK